MTHEQKAQELKENLEMREAYNYYYHNYLKDFDKAEGEPICFAEFFDNDWQQLRGDR